MWYSTISSRWRSAWRISASCDPMSTRVPCTVAEAARWNPCLMSRVWPRGTRPPRTRDSLAEALARDPTYLPPARCVNILWDKSVTLGAKRSDGPERRPLEGARMRQNAWERSSCVRQAAQAAAPRPRSRLAIAVGAASRATAAPPPRVTAAPSRASRGITAPHATRPPCLRSRRRRSTPRGTSTSAAWATPSARSAARYPSLRDRCLASQINKAQGQTLRCVGVHLPKPCFAHGQLYVAASRVGRPAHTSASRSIAMRRPAHSAHATSCTARR